MQTTRRKHHCRCNPKHATTCCKRRSGCSRIALTQQQTLLGFPASPTKLPPTQRRSPLYLRRLVDLITLEPTSATPCSTLSVAVKPYAKRVDKHLFTLLSAPRIFASPKQTLRPTITRMCSTVPLQSTWHSVPQLLCRWSGANRHSKHPVHHAVFLRSSFSAS